MTNEPEAWVCVQLDEKTLLPIDPCNEIKSYEDFKEACKEGKIGEDQKTISVFLTLEERGAHNELLRIFCRAKHDYLDFIKPILKRTQEENNSRKA